MRRSARSWIPDDYIGERVMWLNRRHATPGRDSRQERYRGRGTTDAAALLEYLTCWGPGLLRLGAIMSFGGYCVSRPGLLRLGAVVG